MTASGRAVLVTGASRGIGRAVAQAFASQGDRVAVHHRDSAALAREVLAGLPGEGHTVVRADLADADAVRRMVDQAAADLGGLDVLVNNAGIYVWHPITEVSYEQWQDVWQQTVAVNLTGAANATWCAVQHMKDTGGRIVNVTSRGAFRGEPRHPAYGAWPALGVRAGIGVPCAWRAGTSREGPGLAGTWVVVSKLEQATGLPTGLNGPPGLGDAEKAFAAGIAGAYNQLSSEALPSHHRPEPGSRHALRAEPHGL